MSFLFNKHNHFNLANIVTFFNIASGVFAIYFLTHHEFFAAALFAWLAGGFDIATPLYGDFIGKDRSK